MRWWGSGRKSGEVLQRVASADPTGELWSVSHLIAVLTQVLGFHTSASDSPWSRVACAGVLVAKAAAVAWGQSSKKESQVLGV